MAHLMVSVPEWERQVAWGTVAGQGLLRDSFVGLMVRNGAFHRCWGIWTSTPLRSLTTSGGKRAASPSAVVG